MAEKERATAPSSPSPPDPLPGPQRSPGSAGSGPRLLSDHGDGVGAPVGLLPPPAELPPQKWRISFLLVGGAGDRAEGFLHYNPNNPHSR
jgi:hypothetical protein